MEGESAGLRKHPTCTRPSPGRCSHPHQCFFPRSFHVKLGNISEAAPLRLSQRFALVLCTSLWFIHQGTQTGRGRLPRLACFCGCNPCLPFVSELVSKQFPSARTRGDGNASLSSFSSFPGKLTEVSLRFPAKPGC